MNTFISNALAPLPPVFLLHSHLFLFLFLLLLHCLASHISCVITKDIDQPPRKIKRIGIHKTPSCGLKKIVGPAPFISTRPEISANTGRAAQRHTQGVRPFSNIKSGEREAEKMVMNKRDLQAVLNIQICRLKTPVKSLR